MQDLTPPTVPGTRAEDERTRSLVVGRGGVGGEPNPKPAPYCCCTSAALSVRVHTPTSSRVPFSIECPEPFQAEEPRTSAPVPW